jgi:hypothetical protein
MGNCEAFPTVQMSRLLAVAGNAREGLLGLHHHDRGFDPPGTQQPQQLGRDLLVFDALRGLLLVHPVSSIRSLLSPL